MRLKIKDLSIRYESKGKGRTLLFLHGWGGRWESWYPVFYPLSKSFNVVALDLPGFGESEQPKDVWGLSEYAEFIKDFTRKLGLKDVTIIGHSFGGAIAIKCPCCRLVLVDASGIRTKKINPLLVLKHLPIPEKFRNFFRSDDYRRSGEMKEIFKKVVAEDLSSELSKIDIPTLIIWGEKDKDTPLTDGKLLNEKIKGSRLKVLTNCGHFSYLEKPEDFCEIIEEFVR